MRSDWHPEFCDWAKPVLSSKGNLDGCSQLRAGVAHMPWASCYPGLSSYVFAKSWLITALEAKNLPWYTMVSDSCILVLALLHAAPWATV